MAQVSYGTITITDNNDIEKIYMEYAQSTSNQAAPTSGWDTDIPTWQQGKYIWQRTVTKMSGVALSSDSYGEPVCLTGSTGSTGAAGRSVSSIITTYCNYGEGTPADNYSGWQSTVPAYDSTKPNYWVKTVITYSNPTETSTTKYKDNGITSATNIAAAANSTAQAANQTANQANTTAGEAKTIAEDASSAISDLNQYFWRQKTATTNVPAGSYVTNIPGTTYKNNPASGGFNSLVQASGIFLRNGITTLSSWTGDALTFNNPSTGNAQLIIGANGTLQSGNYSRGNSSKFSSTGTRIDLTNGDIITQYFRVSQGLESGVNAGAYVHGVIEAISGKIGADSTNYWEIGEYTDYNLTTNATMIGHGGSFIQLGDSSTWRLATNRLHTGWYSSGTTTLNYPTIDSKYWDFGIHAPTSETDKFVYIRSSKDNTSSSGILQRLLYDIDDTYATPQWDYQFYIDGSGNVHAPGFYIGDSTTPIGGGAGTVAERLTQGYGSATQPIYFNSNGVPTNTTYQLNAAGAKGVDTLISAASTSTNLPTSQAVAAFVEGKGYSTTDNKVQTSQANTTKIYLAGTSTAGTSTGTLNFDSNVYLTTTAGTLHATTFEGNLSGTASRATADGDGNTIKTTYLKLSGGNVTGAVSFGSSVSADELTVGDLVVNGAASFTNNLQANMINGVTVGSNPKFTDTTYTFANGTNGFTVTPLGGTAQTVTVTPSITNNVTGSGTSGYLVKFTGTNTIGNGPQITSGGTGFLRQDGTWATPGGTYSLPLAASGTRGGVQIGFTTDNANRNYAVQLSSEKMYVNVPWENTTYESKAAASGGTDVSLVTTDEKYTWNQKTSNTGTVTSVATSSPITGGTITGTGTIGHATSGVGNAVTTVGLYKFKYDTYGHVTGVSAIAKADITGLGIPAQDTTYSNASTTTAGLMSAADKKKLDDIQVDSSGQAVAANVAGRWGIDVTFSDTNVAQVGHANSAITASNTQASTVSSATTKTALSFGSIVKLPYISYDTYGHVTSKSEVYFQLPAAPSSTTNATNDSDGNPINTTYIKKSIGTAAGDIIYWSAANTPVRLAKGSNGQVLKLANGVPTWGTDNNDNTWRGIQDNLTSSTNTTESLSAKQGYLLATGSARDSTKLPLAGGTMTGQIKTSFKSSVATGSYQSSQTTVENLCEELRYSSGVMGSVSISTAYTKDNITIATGWYNFLWVPHRSGGLNGAASGDNCDYGSLYLSGMTVSGLYMVRYTSKAIAEVKNLYKPPAAISADSATSAGKWSTARNFTIKDSDSTNSGTATSVDGSAAVTLLLPSTIKASLTGNASTATKWASAQTVYVTLGTASTSTTIQGGSSSAQTIGVNGTLGVSNGGTGITSNPSMLTNLGSTTAASVFQTSPRPGVTGTLGAANGGTGQTSLINAANSLLNALSTGSSIPQDNDYYISQYVNGGTTTTTYHRRPMSALWSYISGKISSSGTYVTIAGDNETITGTKSFNNILGTKYVATKGGFGCEINYNSTLDALVFSFA